MEDIHVYVQFQSDRLYMYVNNSWSLNHDDLVGNLPSGYLT